MSATGPLDLQAFMRWLAERQRECEAHALSLRRSSEGSFHGGVSDEDEDRRRAYDVGKHIAALDAQRAAYASVRAYVRQALTDYVNNAGDQR